MDWGTFFMWVNMTVTVLAVLVVVVAAGLGIVQHQKGGD